MKAKDWRPTELVLTWRDISLPSREEAWRQLRGLRMTLPGATATNAARAATFQAALEQAQQLMTAAEGAGYATRPLQLFYALSQGGRAIAAASVRLPTTVSIPDRENPGQFKAETIAWMLRGHGITAPATSQNRIAKVTVKADWTGLMPGVAAAIGVQGLVPGEKVNLGDLWPLIPESNAVPLNGSPKFPALSFGGGKEPLEGSGSTYQVPIGFVPDSVRQDIGDDQKKLSLFLDRYPSLRGYIFPAADGNPLGWQPDDSGKACSLPVYWPHPQQGDPEWGKAARELKSFRYRGSVDWWAFPSVGSMAESLHPLLVWWAVLFALSMMARYEPNNWAKMIQIDVSGEANAIEHILDQALDIVPTLLLEAIHLAIAP
ncbi:hypothetical protein Lfu02_31550 [Longispora fulva]|uniref:Uncharacterized protein n=1 Tax=Longispora fulva TaxID=619741 RepID=A0A8J7GVW8_9ACTN|nr:hypothetical protein [Longispora fulva]MBG6139288.1 hypothetical protein [Longispora fulva]GIG58783.1 hypothetical protein Lfu02_31550 [Longispora fulva]